MAKKLNEDTDPRVQHSSLSHNPKGLWAARLVGPGFCDSGRQKGFSMFFLGKKPDWLPKNFKFRDELEAEEKARQYAMTPEGKRINRAANWLSVSALLLLSSGLIIAGMLDGGYKIFGGILILFALAAWVTLSNL